MNGHTRWLDAYRQGLEAHRHKLAIYPEADGELSEADGAAIYLWLRKRSLLHVIRNWFKVRK